MLKGINYWAFPVEADGFPVDPVKAMQEAHRIGYDCFELTVERKGYIHPDMSREEAEWLKKEAQAIGIQLKTLATALGWEISPTDPDPEVRKESVKMHKKILQIANWLGVETLLYIPGMVSAPFVEDYDPQPYDEVDKRAREALKELLPVARKMKVRIAVENVWNRYLLSPLEMRDFIDSFNSKWIGAYFDVGNIMLYGHPEHWIKILGDRIKAVHFKDFKTEAGNVEGFVQILKGDVDFPEVMKAFRDIDYKGPFIAEVFPIHPYILERTFRAMKKIEEM